MFLIIIFPYERIFSLQLKPVSYLFVPQGHFRLPKKRFLKSFFFAGEQFSIRKKHFLIPKYIFALRNNYVLKNSEEI
jgi:hypothetical protein